MTKTEDTTREPFLTRFVRARQTIGALPRTATAKISTRGGGGFSYSYTPLDDIFAALVPAFAAEGIAVFHTMAESEGGGVLITANITDTETNETVSASCPIPLCNDPKELGGWITYVRRYTLVAAAGIASEDDKDAPPEHQPSSKPAATKAKAKTKASAPAKGGNNSKGKLPVGSHTVTIFDAAIVKEGDGWTLYVIYTDAGEVATFSSTVFEKAKAAIDQTAELLVSEGRNGKPVLDEIITPDIEADANLAVELAKRYWKASPEAVKKLGDTEKDAKKALLEITKEVVASNPDGTVDEMLGGIRARVVTLTGDSHPEDGDVPF